MSRLARRLLLALLVLIALVGTARRASAETGTPPVGVAPDLSALAGRPVTKIDVVVEGERWTSPRPSIATVHLGESFSAEVARRALAEVLGSGLFATGTVSAAAEGAGVRLIVRAEPRRLVAEVSLALHGAPFDGDELLREVELAEGRELLAEDLPVRAERLKRSLVRRGFPSASVDIDTRDTDDPVRVVVLVDVRAGTPRVIGRRVFYVFDAEPRELASLDGSYGVDKGARADDIALDAADDAHARRLAAAGYFKARVTHDVVDAGGVATARVRIDAGPRYVPRFEGNDHYDDDTLAAALHLEDDRDRSAGRLVDALRDFYRRRGFLDVEVRLEERAARGGQLRELVFHLRENPRVHVVLRSYPCLREAEIKGLSRGGPRTATEVGSEVDSFLEEELPGAELFRGPEPAVLESLVAQAALATGARPAPVDLEPRSTYFPDSYDRALQHVQELYRSEGYLSAEVGPLELLRRTCARRSPAGRCVALPLRAIADVCPFDSAGVPLPMPSTDAANRCVPDPARGVECEPLAVVRVPIRLGPRTHLWDIAFDGVHAIAESALVKVTDLRPGEPLNTLKLEETARALLEAYREEGFAYAEAKYTLEFSADRSRARVRFAIREGEQVHVLGIVLRGNELTRASTVRSRVALEPGQPYRASLVRKTQERIATLGVFSSVTVTLESPFVQERHKNVVITLVERPTQAIELRPGFSTGEGIRLTAEYNHRNLFQYAVSGIVRMQLAYLPTALILDDEVRRNFTGLGEPGLNQRLVVRGTGSVTLPDVGLGPLVRLTMEAGLIRDLQRQFAFRKILGSGTLIYTPIRELSLSLGPSVEGNDVKLFGAAGSIADFLRNTPASSDLQRLLRVPDGESVAVAERLGVSWDRRDNPFNPHRGTFVSAGVEHVDTYPLSDPTVDKPTFQGHFLRLTQTFSGYLPLTRSITFAAQLRLGEIVHVRPASVSKTYPDRLFFLGGADSLRGFLQDTVVPQDLIDAIQVDGCPSDPDDHRFSICQVGIRGGNLMINPRAELRIPVHTPLELALFVDSGNIWVDPLYIFEGRRGFKLRFASGLGVRIQSPFGPVVLDYGVNLNRNRTWEDFGAFSLSIGVF